MSDPTSPRSPRRSPTRILRFARPLLIAASLIAVPTACGRPMRYAELPPMRFDSERSPIDGVIEACVPPKLRGRIWDVYDHPFRVSLGERAALNFERLVKASFRKVVTTFDENCGSRNALPWITANIESANRELDADAYDEQVTVITMSFELYSAEGELLWQTTTVGETFAEPAGIGGRRSAAARDMGGALGMALELGYDALIESDNVRRHFEAAAELSRRAPRSTPDA